MYTAVKNRQLKKGLSALKSLLLSVEGQVSLLKYLIHVDYAAHYYPLRLQQIAFKQGS